MPTEEQEYTSSLKILLSAIQEQEWASDKIEISNDEFKRMSELLAPICKLERPSIVTKLKDKSDEILDIFNDICTQNDS